MLIYILYILLSPFLWIILFLCSLTYTKIGSHWRSQWITVKNTKRQIRASLNNRKILLFHAASAGEFEQLKPILKLIDKEQYFVVQSFFSPTIYEKEFNTELADCVCYHPFDFLWSAILFFKSINPDYYIITRHDIWPTHVFIAKFFKVKTMLINANLHNDSVRLKFGIKFFNRWLFSNFNKILTGSERLKNNLEKLTNPCKIISTGDSRFDRVKSRKENAILNHFPESINNTRNILLGSLIESDLDKIFTGIQKSYPGGEDELKEKKHRLIIVPHETDETDLIQIEEYCKKLQLSPVRFSNMGNNLSNTVIIDRVGILADLYGYADMAYVGGGFGAGVHSVIEPAVYGCAVSFGPNIEILDEAIEMYDRNIGIMIHSGEDFYKFLKLLDNTDKLNQIQSDTGHFVQNKSNSSPLIIKEIFNDG